MCYNCYKDILTFHFHYQIMWSCLFWLVWAMDHETSLQLTESWVCARWVRRSYVEADWLIGLNLLVS